MGIGRHPAPLLIPPATCRHRAPVKMLPQQVIRQYPPMSNTRRPTLSMTIHCKGKGPQ